MLSISYSLRISGLPAQERPRERLLSLGVKQLSLAGLLAILLGSGQDKLSAVGLEQYKLLQNITVVRSIKT